MTWADDIDLAMKRGRSPYRAEDLIRWLRSGAATFAVTESMSASIWWDGPDGPEIAHIAGKWHNNDAAWLYSRMKRECQTRGVDFVQINGRNGWPRFFRMKGISICQRAEINQRPAAPARATALTLH